MSCEDFQNEIAEVVAAGTQPGQQLRVHLDRCNTCGEAFAAEKLLYASIGSGVRATINSEVPSSFLPNVRMRLREENVSGQRWSFSWPAAAGVAAVVFGVALVVTMWQSKLPFIADKPPSIAGASTAAAPRYPERIPSGDGVLQGSSEAHRKRINIPGATHSQKPADGSLTSEVIVPRDQEMLLASYAREMRGRKSLVVAERHQGTPEVAPIQVEPIQIAELDVKPLADELAK
jgi:hypothetical protein